MIKQFIRNDKGEKIGIMIADAVGEDSYGIGYSIAREGSEDVFDESLGMTIAQNRANSLRANKKIANGSALVHTNHEDELYMFMDRAARYFQDRKLLTVSKEIVEV